MREGAALGDPESLDVIRERVRQQLGRLHRGIRRFDYPHQYPVGLEKGLELSGRA